MVEKTDEKQQVGEGRIVVSSPSIAQFEGQNSLNPGHNEVGRDFFRQAGR